MLSPNENFAILLFDDRYCIGEHLTYFKRLNIKEVNWYNTVLNISLPRTVFSITNPKNFQNWYIREIKFPQRYQNFAQM